MKEMINLSNCEWKLMKLLWANDSMTVGQIVEAVEDDTHWNKNTVFTMLKRLEEKGAVKMLTTKRPQQYAATISREEASIEETNSFLSRVYDGNLRMFVSALSGNCALNQKEIDDIRALLDEAEREISGKEE